MKTSGINISGTLIWYYYICKREVWLLAHGIEADQDHELLEMGRIISENTYRRDKKEINIGNIKVDLIRREHGQLIVGEVKKSSRYEKAATMQLLFYLKTLKKNNIDAKGRLFFPDERKTTDIILDDSAIGELDKAEDEILKIVYQDKPPKAIKKKFCKKCAYSDFCFA